MKNQPEYIAKARADIQSSGTAVISDFFTPDTIQTMLTQVEPSLDQAFSKLKTHNVYLLADDDALPADHARNAKVTTSSATLAHDLIPAGGLRDLYDSDDFKQMLCDILGLDGLYPYADPLAGLNVLSYPPGAQTGWHFDNANFVVTLLLRQAEKGGGFEFVPNSRSADDEGYDAVTALHNGDTSRVKSMHQMAGDLVIFQGKHTVHQVTPVQGSATRVIAVFSYDTKPGTMLHADTRQKFFGRTG